MPYKDPVRQREFQRNRCSDRRAKYIAQAGSACVKCGSDQRLEFDHKDRATKTDHRIWSWSTTRLEEELAKCQLLCNACHKQKSREESYVHHEHGDLKRYENYGCRCDLCRAASAASKAAWRKRVDRH